MKQQDRILCLKLKVSMKTNRVDIQAMKAEVTMGVMKISKTFEKKENRKKKKKNHRQNQNLN